MNYIAWMTEWLGSLIFEHNLITMDEPTSMLSAMFFRHLPNTEILTIQFIISVRSRIYLLITIDITEKLLKTDTISKTLRCLSFCTFSFSHCVVCSSSIYGFLITSLVSSNSSYILLR